MTTRKWGQSLTALKINKHKLTNAKLGTEEKLLGVESTLSKMGKEKDKIKVRESKGIDSRKNER